MKRIKEVIFMKKNFRDVAVMALALGTAFGLGVLTTVYTEVKLFAEVCETTKKEKQMNG